MSRGEWFHIYYYENENLQEHCSAGSVTTADLEQYLEELNVKEVSIYKKLIVDFLTDGCIYYYKDKKKLMQALRHFDEVGISNELWDILDNIPKSCTHFYIMCDKCFQPQTSFRFRDLSDITL